MQSYKKRKKLGAYDLKDEYILGSTTTLGMSVLGFFKLHWLLFSRPSAQQRLKAVKYAW